MSEFLAGLGTGIVAAFSGVLGSVALRRRMPLPIHGLLLASAGLVGLYLRFDPPPALLLGVGLLVAGGVAYPRVKEIPLVAFALSLPGAAIVAYGALPDAAAWQQAYALVVVVIGGPLLAGFSYRYRSQPFTPILVAGTIFGAYVALPDTEEILVLLGAALALALTGWPAKWLTTGPAGSLAVVGVYMWVAVQGSADLVPPLIGAAGALGLFIAEPISRLFARSGDRLAVLRSWSVYGVVAAHAGAVFFGGRVAGTQRHTVIAAAIAVAAIGAATIGLGAMDTRQQRAGPSPAADQGPE